MKFLKSALGLSMVLASGSLIGCMTADDGGTAAVSAEEAYLRSQGNVDGKVSEEGMEKVSVCHVPPGNPANSHTITIGSPAVKAHLAHGDYLGECAEQPPVDTDPPVVDPPVDTDPPTDPDDGTGEET